MGLLSAPCDIILIRDEKKQFQHEGSACLTSAHAPSSCLTRTAGNENEAVALLKE